MYMHFKYEKKRKKLINYNYFNGNDRKDCLGFKSIDKDFFSIGTNFMYGKALFLTKIIKH